MVLLRCQDISRYVNRTKIQRYARRIEFTGDSQIVFQVHVAQEIGVEPTWQITSIGVPVEQVKSARQIAFEIAVDDEMPYQVVRPQCRKRACELASRHATRCAEFTLALLDILPVDIDAYIPGVGKVQHRRQQGQRRYPVLSFCGDYCQRTREQGATYTKTQCVDA